MLAVGFDDMHAYPQTHTQRLMSCTSSYKTSSCMASTSYLSTPQVNSFQKHKNDNACVWCLSLFAENIKVFRILKNVLRPMLVDTQTSLLTTMVVVVEHGIEMTPCLYLVRVRNEYKGSLCPQLPPPLITPLPEADKGVYKGV